VSNKLKTQMLGFAAVNCRMLVRGWHFSLAAEDAVVATLYYPADERRLNEAHLTGRVPALPPNPETGWPLVVIMPGINIAPDSYRWLAKRFVAEGLCAVTYSAIGSLGPAGNGITPGLDTSALTPEAIGTRSCATVLRPLLQRIADADPNDCPVAGSINLEQVVIGGHSAGGTVALHNSDPAWVPGLQGTFTYAAHTMVASALGHAEQTVLPVPAKVPLMLLAGTQDQVIAVSRSRYRNSADLGIHNPIKQTFNEALNRNRNDSWFVELRDLGHFAICSPLDDTSGRSFLEGTTATTSPASREFLGDLISAFVATVLKRQAVDQLERLVQNVLVTRYTRR